MKRGLGASLVSVLVLRGLVVDGPADVIGISAWPATDGYDSVAWQLR